MNQRTDFSFILITVVILFAAQPVMGGIDLPVEEHFLSNGMKVITVERSETPVVSMALYYRVGSIDEKEGKTGIAHYCEHMMFKSTRHLSGEQYSRLMGASGGGHSNANTSSDRTCYHATIPPDRLELLIRLEAERMGYLEPTREEAARELEVVLEELRLNYIDDPGGKLRWELYNHAFEKHPYKTVTIGRLEDVESITYEDLMEFQRKYYAPANAFAVVVGNFEIERLLELMETFFGSLPSGQTSKRNYPLEPEQTKEKRFKIIMPVRSPYYLSGYKAPPASHPDNLALQALCSILSRGGSSPFGRLSQGEGPVAMYAYAWCRASLDPDLLLVGGRPLPGVSVEELEARMQKEIERIIREGVTEKELERARTQILAEDVYAMQSTMGIAFNLGEAEIVNTWKDALTLEERLNSLTIRDIQEVADRYLQTEKRTVGVVVPGQSENDATPGRNLNINE